MSDRLTITIEGSGNKKVLLPELVRQLEAMIKMLNHLAEDDKATVEVISMHMNSPLVTELRTVRLIQSTDRKTKQKRSERRPNNRPTRTLERTLGKLRSGEEKNFNKYLADFSAISSFGSALKGNTAIIEADGKRYEISKETLSQVNLILTTGQTSYGDIAGQLIGVDVSDDPRFIIRPLVGIQKVYCKFSPDDDRLFEIIKDNFRKKAVLNVSGIQYFRKNADFPHMVDVDSVEIIDAAPKGAWSSFMESYESLWLSSTQEERELLLADF